MPWRKIAAEVWKCGVCGYVHFDGCGWHWGAYRLTRGCLDSCVKCIQMLHLAQGPCGWPVLVFVSVLYFAFTSSRPILRWESDSCHAFNLAVGNILQNSMQFAVWRTTGRGDCFGSVISRCGFSIGFSILHQAHQG